MGGRNDDKLPTVDADWPLQCELNSLWAVL